MDWKVMSASEKETARNELIINNNNGWELLTALRHLNRGRHGEWREHVERCLF
jgi:hypothetical protein